MFDPAFGLGNFAAAAQQFLPTVQFEGMEKDSAVLDFWGRNAVRTENVSVEPADYLLRWGKQYEAIVCNPPYMRFQQFIARSAVFQSFSEKLRLQLSGFTNIASAFLVKSISELVPGGRLAYLMPLDFLGSGYGVAVKRYLLEQGWLHSIFRFEKEREIFPDVLTTLGMLFFEKGKTGASTRFVTIKNLADVREPDFGESGIDIRTEYLTPERKWDRFFQYEAPMEVPADFVPLTGFGKFLRGIATGANEYFMLTAIQKEELALADSEVIPCVSKSRQVEKKVLAREDFEELANRNLPVFLLNPGKKLSKGMKSYLKQGEENGVSQRYLTKNRSPWYLREPKNVARLWVGTFSRNRYHVVLNLADVWNLTCFHGFYPIEGMETYVDRLFLFFASKVGQGALSTLVRKYGNGLGKLEPGDLNRLVVPSAAMLDRLSDEAVCSEIRHVHQKNSLSSKTEKFFDEMMRKTEN